MRNQEENWLALNSPRPGDYWHEMFCPYFIVVNVEDDKFRVLSCLGGPTSFTRKNETCARIDNGDGTWSFDPSKSMLVDQEWIHKTVCYDQIDGFVADVVHSEKTMAIVQEWRNWHQKNLRQQIKMLEEEWERFTGWQYLKEDFVK